ncbi:MAG: hypothetical protein JXA28_04940 [Bacteroidetes bacterium]|nr:hypothetical protein [Bacteroidota bacterium]
MNKTRSSTRSRPRALHPTLLLTLILLLIAGGMFLYTSVLLPVGYELRVDPPRLYTGRTDSACVTAFAVNRLGGSVPFSRPRITVTVEEGAALVDLRMSADSTEAIILPRDRAGLVLLHVRTAEWPFPMLASLHITVPMASDFRIHGEY